MCNQRLRTSKEKVGGTAYCSLVDISKKKYLEPFSPVSTTYRQEKNAQQTSGGDEPSPQACRD